MTRIQHMRKIVKTKTAAMIEDDFVDLFSASAYVQIYDRLNKLNREDLESCTTPEAMRKVWLLVGRRT